MDFYIKNSFNNHYRQQAKRQRLDLLPAFVALRLCFLQVFLMPLRRQDTKFFLNKLNAELMFFSLCLCGFVAVLLQVFLMPLRHQGSKFFPNKLNAELMFFSLCLCVFVAMLFTSFSNATKAPRL